MNGGGSGGGGGGGGGGDHKEIRLGVVGLGGPGVYGGAHFGCAWVLSRPANRGN